MAKKMKIKSIIKSLVLVLSIVGCQSAESQTNKYFIPKTKITDKDIIPKTILIVAFGNFCCSMC